MFLYQAFSGAIRFLLEVNGYSYLTMENMFRFLSRPVTVAVIVLLLFCCAFFYLIEAVSMILFYQDYVKERKIQVVQILFPGIRESLSLLKRKNGFSILVFALLSAIVTLAPMLALFSIRLRVPAYITQSIIHETIGYGIAAVLVFFCLLINFFGVYVLYYCVLGEYGFWESYKKSVEIIKKHLFHFTFRLAGLNLVLAIIYILVYSVVLMLVCYILYRTKEESLLMAAMLTAYDEGLVYMGVLITVVSQIVNYASFSAYFYKYNNTELVKANQVEKLPKQTAYIRLTIAAAAVTIILIGLSLYDAFRNGSLADKETLFGTYITAHRGYSAKAPENTLPALQLAIENMADFAEIDVQETKDGVVVLMHDINLLRITGKRANVFDLTYAELKELDAGSWFSKEYAGTYIPTLQEAIELCKGKINLNIELKITKFPDLNEDLLKKVVAMIEEYDLEGQCVVSCTNHTLLAKIKEYNSRIKTGYILAFAYGNFYDKSYVDFFSMKSSFVNNNLVRTLHSLGKEVHAWTVNSQSEMERMKQMGVDNIITDKAILAREVIYGENVKLGFFKLLGIIQD